MDQKNKNQKDIAVKGDSGGLVNVCSKSLTLISEGLYENPS